MLDDTAVPRLKRLMHWLEPFAECFGHAAQLVSFGSYVSGLFSDSPRKSMEAMLARVTEAPRYQAFQHFITHAPWEAERVWRTLLAVGAALYLPQAWLDDPARRAKVRIPPPTRFQEKWRLALTLLRRVRAAGIAVTAVVADAGYGDVVLFRAALHRLKLPYALGISSTTTVFPGPPPLVVPPPTGGRGRPRTRPVLVGAPPITVATLTARLAADRWQRIQWRNGRQPPRAAAFAAWRVTPAHDWETGRLAPEVWLLCERRDGDKREEKFYLINLPPRRSLARLVDLVHRRWAIEQQYAETKTELGLDHFEGRSYPGWNHHVVITAVAYAFLQQERGDGTARLTFPQIRAIVQEIFTGLFFAAHPRYLDWIQRARELLPLRLI